MAGEWAETVRFSSIVYQLSNSLGGGKSSPREVRAPLTFPKYSPGKGLSLKVECVLPQSTLILSGKRSTLPSDLERLDISSQQWKFQRKKILLVLVS